MSLVRYNPLRDIERVPKTLTNFLSEFFPETPLFSGWETLKRGLDPVVDIYESKDAIIVEADLPGIDKEDLIVNVEGHILTLKGERKSETMDEGENYYRKEREYGSFSRAFTLPDIADTEHIQADFKNGVLHIKIPKAGLGIASSISV